MMQKNNPKKTLTIIELYWLATGTFLTLLPHGIRMPLWILPLTAALIFWRLAGEFNNRILPKPGHQGLRILQIFIMIGGIAGVYFSFHALAGREAGSALLVILAGFKFLETYSQRDFYIVTFICLFVLTANFFVSESIATAIYMFFTLIIIFTSLITLNDTSKNLSASNRIKLSGYLLLQAIPLMLILFFLFPRIQGPLWGMPRDAFAGKTGIDNVMEPGSISQLIESDEIAFRVEFEGPSPKNSQLYWRGPVLWYNDGHKWLNKDVYGSFTPVIKTSGTPIKYKITLEPTRQYWLFALEMPKKPVEGSYFINDFQLHTREPVNRRTRYQFTSYTDYVLGSGNPRELHRALQLPAGFHYRTINLAESWRSENPDPLHIIRRVLDMFNQENFYYTLTPPILTGDRVDDFLFNTRQGFCEHYASAFTVLMRAAGIPARVVLGYQGGRLNPVGNYFIVQQRDAHAWVEVWLDERGWVRVDPTSAVSPARVEQGITGAIPDLSTDIPAIFGMNQFSRGFWQNLQNTWDAVNNQWIQWVITYGPDRQTRLLRNIGLDDFNITKLSVLLVVTVCLVFVLIALWIFRQYQPPRDQARLLYDIFCNKLSRAGFRRLPHEGPEDFYNKIKQPGKIISDKAGEITRLYISARYGNKEEDLVLLKARVKAFQPKKAD